MSPPGNEPWTIRRVVRWSAEDFAQRGLASPRLDAELLVAHALGITRVKLYMDLDRELGPDELTKVRELVARRRKREPVAYLVGRREFWGRSFTVSPAVLVPRPETETLVERALAILGRRAASPAFEDTRAGQVEADPHAATRVEPDTGTGTGAETGTDAGTGTETVTAPEPGHDPPLPPAGEGRGEGQVALEAEPDREPVPVAAHVLDLCTGTGCIGLTIAAELGTTEVVLTDVSPEALEIARVNLASLASADTTLAARVTTRLGDLYAALSPDDRFELIACNPPYLSERELTECEPDVRDHEPKLALVSGPSGDEVLAGVARGARERLRPGGTLLVEIGAEQGPRVRQLFLDAGLADVAVHRDLSGRDRVVEGRAPADHSG